MKQTVQDTSDTKNIVKKTESRIALGALLSGVAVFLFALAYFITVHVLGSGNSKGMPLVLVKQDGDWMLIRSEHEQLIDPDMTGYDFVYNAESKTYDLVLHFNEFTENN